jgi:hypothetical protein
MGLSKKKTFQAAEKVTISIRRFVSGGSYQGIALAMPKAILIRRPFRG